ncbi:threonine synthase [Anthocerotibacter panamensis]|uniref:threonine synthase n=1 Tax=Anthocerotibacter panamensis TaxID=2857077 RepID=UPI001C408146|nr:threonine synthase [Anthocerotibacter panamensis]
MPSHVSHLYCPRCALTYDHRQVQNLCSCGAPLLVDYDLKAIACGVTKAMVAHRPATMWRYREFLPVEEPENIVSLEEGLTPLYSVTQIGEPWGLPDLWLKDDGANPTGSFKARGASCGISRARELGVHTVALPTAGNAGGAWACYGARAGLRVHVAMPQDAPLSNQLECGMYGAELTLVDGLISDAGRLIAQGIQEHGWYDAATLKEPYRIEGKKTLGLEIAEQLGWKMPDAIIYPCGGGVGVIGIWLALQQLRTMGWVEGGLPRLIIAQAEGCAPLVKAFHEGKEVSEFWAGAETFSSGLRVPKALGDFLVLRAIRETGGTAIAIADAMAAQMMSLLARTTGIFAAPEGAATLAAARLLAQQGFLQPQDRVVVINTGTALKYPEAIQEALRQR